MKGLVHIAENPRFVVRDHPGFLRLVLGLIMAAVGIAFLSQALLGEIEQRLIGGVLGGLAALFSLPVGFRKRQVRYYREAKVVEERRGYIEPIPRWQRPLSEFQRIRSELYWSDGKQPELRRRIVLASDDGEDVVLHQDLAPRDDERIERLMRRAAETLDLPTEVDASEPLPPTPTQA